MKRNLPVPLRKHGARAQLQALGLVRVRYEADARETVCAARSRTLLTFESGRQSCRWYTDRGRSRVVLKH